jgi:two-component system, OmpR family, sensor histidine kinase CssS
MKTINQTITKPIIIILMIVPIIIMILFNVSLRFYINNQTKKELIQLIDNIESQTENILLRNDTTTSIALTQLRTTLRLSQFTQNTELIVFNSRQQLIHPTSFENSFITNSLINHVKDINTSNEVQRFRFQGNTYVFAEKEFEGRVLSYRIILITAANSADGLLRFINLILILILILSLLITIFIIVRTTKKITQPLHKTIEGIDEITKGNFSHINPQSKTIEINKLITGFNEMSQQLQDAQQTQRLFFQNASHELRTPLMSIQGYAEGLKQSIFTHPDEIGNRILKESNKLKELVDQLLILTRLEGIDFNQEYSTISISDFLQECIRNFDEVAILNNKKFLLDCTDNEEIRSHPILLTMIVNNLVSNSLRYAKSNITISASIISNRFVLTVQDDGDGISTQDLPYIFERFYKGKNGNSGLGLSIVHRCVELLKGEISVENKNGAIFIVKIPL